MQVSHWAATRTSWRVGWVNEDAVDGGRDGPPRTKTRNAQAAHAHPDAA
jgi:hypothetical protein